MAARSSLATGVLRPDATLSSWRQAAVEAGAAVAVVRNATAGEAVAAAAGRAALVPDCAAVAKAVRQPAAAAAKMLRLRSPVATSRPDAAGLERPGLLPSKWRAQWLPGRRHAEATPRMEAVLALRGYGEVPCSTAPRSGNVLGELLSGAGTGGNVPTDAVGKGIPPALLRVRSKAISAKLLHDRPKKGQKCHTTLLSRATSEKRDR